MIGTNLEILEKYQSIDGSTKYLMKVPQGSAIEAIAFELDQLPHLCISTQAGCNVGCPFCETGKTKTKVNLSGEEIVGQVATVADDLNMSRSVTAFHDVSMAGMGEALLNYDSVVKGASAIKDNGLSKEISVTTSGIVPRIAQLADSCVDNLTISLHATLDSIRSELVPVNRKYPIRKLLAAAREYGQKRSSKVVVNYLLFDQLNDTEEDLHRLLDLLDPNMFEVHLKVWNMIDDAEFHPSLRFDMFQSELEKTGFSVRTSRSAGADIGGGCGQLGAKRRQ